MLRCGGTSLHGTWISALIRLKRWPAATLRPPFALGVQRPQSPDVQRVICSGSGKVMSGTTKGGRWRNVALSLQACPRRPPPTTKPLLRALDAISLCDGIQIVDSNTYLIISLWHCSKKTHVMETWPHGCRGDPFAHEASCRAITPYGEGETLETCLHNPPWERRESTYALAICHSCCAVLDKVFPKDVCDRQQPRDSELHHMGL